MFQDLKTRLVRDARANWRKTALLAVLFAVGLCFWVPLLLKGLGGSKPAKPTARVPRPAAAPAPSVPQTPPSPAVASPAAVPAPAAVSWKQLAYQTGNDPLLQPAVPADVRRDPFRLDRGPFSPPVLFAAEPLAVGPQVIGPQAPPTHRPQLTSTVIGSRLRAALIDGRVYREGAGIVVDGVQWQISAVLPRRVVLARDREQMELTLSTTSPTPAAD
ncbi:MAG: hypothetical protein KY476_08285 [Planctomycetes bacterium]|nr:hypothetical protein [Planctomycetota bacterium]